MKRFKIEYLTENKNGPSLEDLKFAHFPKNSEPIILEFPGGDVKTRYSRLNKRYSLLNKFVWEHIYYGKIAELKTGIGRYVKKYNLLSKREEEPKKKMEQLQLNFD